MDFTLQPISRYVRIIAIVVLVVGLFDAARLLGVMGGSVNPVSDVGSATFFPLASFTIARLFAAVGLWIRASWGAVVLIGATVMELLLFFVNASMVSLDWPALAIRILVLIAVGLLIFFSLRLQRARVHD